MIKTTSDSTHNSKIKTKNMENKMGRKRFKKKKIKLNMRWPGDGFKIVGNKGLIKAQDLSLVYNQ